MILISALALIPVLVTGGWIRAYEVGFFSLGYSVRQTLDSGYIVVGEISEEDESDGDLLMIKTDSVGDTLWTRTYGGGVMM